MDFGIIFFLLAIGIGTYWGYTKICSLEDSSGETPWSSRDTARTLDFSARENYNKYIASKGDSIKPKEKEIALRIRGTEAVKRYFGVQNERKDFSKIEHLLSPVVKEREEAMFKEVDKEMVDIQEIAGEMKEGWDKSFLQECADALGQKRKVGPAAGHGHSHDGAPCHGHNNPAADDHGHSHNESEHGHSHDGAPCHGHNGSAQQGNVGEVSLAISIPSANRTPGKSPLEGDPEEIVRVQRMITTPDGKKPYGEAVEMPRKNLQALLTQMKAQQVK
eukprot:CFRG1651T1